MEASSAHMTVEKLRVTVFMCIEQCAIKVAVIYVKCYLLLHAIHVQAMSY